MKKKKKTNNRFGGGEQHGKTFTCDHDLYFGLEIIIIIVIHILLTIFKGNLDSGGCDEGCRWWLMIRGRNYTIQENVHISDHLKIR